MPGHWGSSVSSRFSGRSVVASVGSDCDAISRSSAWPSPGVRAAEDGGAPGLISSAATAQSVRPLRVPDSETVDGTATHEPKDGS